MSKQTDPSQHLIVLGFDSTTAAQEALTATLRLQEEGKLLLRDAVFVTKDEKGRAHVVETTDPSPGQAALSGSFWGLLFGALLLVPIAGLVIGAATSALMAKLVDVGVSDDFVKELRSSIEPGKTYLALLVSHEDEAAITAELKRFQGIAQFVTGTMPPEALEHVKEALADVSTETSES